MCHSKNFKKVKKYMHVSKLLHLLKTVWIKELSPKAALDIALVYPTHVTAN